MTLAQAMAQGRANNFDLIRLIAAMGVVISHAWPLAHGPGTAEPLEHLTGTALGGISVLIFFFLSGMMISESAWRWRSRKQIFVMSRLLRIFPGLAVALALTAASALTFGSTAGFPELLRYWLKGMSLVSIEHRLSDAWLHNPYPLAVNGPLWTLFYEVLCYGVFAVIVWSGTLLRFLPAVLLIAATCTVLARDVLPAALAYRFDVFAPLFFAFAVGHLAWVFRDRVPLFSTRTGLAGVTCMFVLVLASALGGLERDQVFVPGAVFLFWFLLVLAYQTPRVRLPGDISYGVYIYGWPVAQICVALLPGVSPLALALISGLAVLVPAVASWIVIERPALDVSRRLRLAWSG